MEEKWRKIKENSNYEISNLGNVRSSNFKNNYRYKNLKCRYLKLQPVMLNEYLVVNINKKLKRISRLVSQAFILNPENKPEVNHINGIKTDNRVENLEWCTSSENQKHAFKTGLQNSKHCTGEEQWNSKLNKMQVRVIRHLKNINPKMSCRKIGEIFKVGRGAIQDIVLYKNWKHI